MKTKKNLISQNRDIASVFVVTAALLTIPLTGIGGWNWDLPDFVVMGVLLISFGLLIVLASRKIKHTKHRVAIIGGILILLLLTWAHLAVGLVDSWPLAGN